VPTCSARRRLPRPERPRSATMSAVRGPSALWLLVQQNGRAIWRDAVQGECTPWGREQVL
jgi:hypothetical protein